MDYETAMGEMVTRSEAKAEIDGHGGEGWEMFISEVGDRAEYLGADVLNWLGY